MKTLSAFAVVVLISFLLTEPILASSDLKKFSKGMIQSLIVGLNSSNNGLAMSSVILAGEYRVEESVEHLANIIDSDVSYEIKKAAVFALYQIQNEEVLSVLKSVCIKNECPYLKKCAEVLRKHYLICNPNSDNQVNYGVIY